MWGPLPGSHRPGHAWKVLKRGLGGGPCFSRFGGGVGSQHLFPEIKINRGKSGSCWRLNASGVRRRVRGWAAPPSASYPRIRPPQPQWGPGHGFGWTCLSSDLGQVTDLPEPWFFHLKMGLEAWSLYSTDSQTHPPHLLSNCDSTLLL